MHLFKDFELVTFSFFVSKSKTFKGNQNMATGSAQETQNFVTLKGSVELIVDFFS